MSSDARFAPLVSLSKYLVISNDQFENEYAISYYSPKFVWLIKDSNIQEKDENGNVLSADAFLEQNLKYLKN